MICEIANRPVALGKLHLKLLVGELVEGALGRLQNAVEALNQSDGVELRRLPVGHAKQIRQRLRLPTVDDAISQNDGGRRRDAQPFEFSLCLRISLYVDRLKVDAP